MTPERRKEIETLYEALLAGQAVPSLAVARAIRELLIVLEVNQRAAEAIMSLLNSKEFDDDYRFSMGFLRVYMQTVLEGMQKDDTRTETAT